MSARLLAAVVLLALACSPPVPERRPTSDRFKEAGDHKIQIKVPGTKRSAILHLPPKFAERGPLPVLLAFHGGGGDAKSFQRYAGLDAHADAQGVVVVYPNGTGPHPRRFFVWNAGDCCGSAQKHDVDDVGFVLALLADLANDLELDPARVWATGHSNGAMMAYRLAAEASERIAAIVPIAGADMTKSFAPDVPVAVLHVHSLDDPRAHYGGGPVRGFPLSGGTITHRPVEAGLARWRERDGCRGDGKEAETKTLDGHTATLVDFGPCDDATDVALWKLTGAGHAWPGTKSRLPEKFAGPPTHVITAGDEVFRFVTRFEKKRAPSLLAAGR